MLVYVYGYLETSIKKGDIDVEKIIQKETTALVVCGNEQNFTKTDQKIRRVLT